MKNNKNKKNSAWKNELANGLCEIAFFMFIIAAALAIGLLLPRELGIPFEVLCLLVFLAVFVIISIVFSVLHIRKKTKLERYLSGKTAPYSLFDRTLQDHLRGSLKISLECLGLTAIKIHVDLTEAYKSIGIQGRYKNRYLNAELTETQLAIEYSKTEPDPESVYPVDTDTPDGFLLGTIREVLSKQDERRMA